MASRGEITSLFRSFLRISAKFSDYNVREYTRRRAIDGFRENRHLSNPSLIAFAVAEAKHQLEIAKRQAVIYSSYAPKVKSIMETCTI